MKSGRPNRLAGSRPAGGGPRRAPRGGGGPPWRRPSRALRVGLAPPEAEPFWSTFLKGLLRRGLAGVKLAISDAHEGLKAAIAKVLGATWQRCRVHWMRNALAHVHKGQQTVVAAAPRRA